METKVKFTTPIHKVTSPQTARYTFNAVQVSPGAKNGRVFCAATNGRVLAITEESGYTDRATIVPVLLTKNESTDDTHEVSWDEERKCWQRVAHNRKKGYSVTTAPAVESRFPQMDGVIPNVGAGWRCVTLDPRLLLELATAMGITKEENGITLLIPPAEGGNNSDVKSAMGCLVKTEDRCSIGVIMPMTRSDNTDPYMDFDRFNQICKDFMASVKGPLTKPEPAPAKADNDTRKHTEETHKAEETHKTQETPGATETCKATETAPPGTVVSETAKDDSAVADELNKLLAALTA